MSNLPPHLRRAGIRVKTPAADPRPAIQPVNLTRDVQPSTAIVPVHWLGCRAVDLATADMPKGDTLDIKLITEIDTGAIFGEDTALHALSLDVSTCDAGGERTLVVGNSNNGDPQIVQGQKWGSKDGLDAMLLLGYDLPGLKAWGDGWTRRSIDELLPLANLRQRFAFGVDPELPVTSNTSVIWSCAFAPGDAVAGPGKVVGSRPRALSLAPTTLPIPKGKKLQLALGIRKWSDATFVEPSFGILGHVIGQFIFTKFTDAGRYSV